ncbi:MAG: NYN domain-containing protein [Anaerolineae bacterium]
MNRVSFLIDGFNLYHSVKQASRELGGVSTKWLDIHAFCSSYLSAIGDGATLMGIHYFSALAKHLEATNPDVTRRHQDFLECLRATGVQIELARFKRKEVRCPNCEIRFDRYEEKETDVAIAATLFDLLHSAACDRAVLVTGDTDVAPAVRLAQRLFPSTEILFLFPYARKNKELAGMVKRPINVRKEHYAKHQFPDLVILPDGREIAKPPTW